MQKEKESTPVGRTRAQNRLIFLCWLVYTASYLTKYSYNSNIVAIRSAFGVDNAAAGLVGTMFFFAYGAGQIVSGLCCKKFPKRSVIAASLLLSSVVNVAAACLRTFAPLKYLWLLNGAVLSVLWSILVSVLSENLSERKLGTAIFAMSTTVPAGTIVTYTLAAVFNKLGAFRPVFVVASVVSAVVAAVWFFGYRGAAFAAKREADLAAKTFAENAPIAEKAAAVPDDSAAENSQKTENVPLSSPGEKKKARVPAVMFALAGFAVVCNLVKDGLGTWVPAILKDTFGFGDGLSVALTLILPVLGIFAAAFALFLHKKLNDFSAELPAEFALATIALAAVLFAVNRKIAVVVVLCFGLTSLIMHAINNLITSMAPLLLRDRIDAGRSAGLLNGCCYAGSAISGYLLGVFADTCGWNRTMALLLCLTVAATVFAAGFRIFTRRGKNEEAAAASPEAEEQNNRNDQ